MEWLTSNLGNIVALLFVVIVVGLALRSVVSGGALDRSSCNGECGGCGGTCKNPQLKLSKEQLDKLDELDREYGVSR